MFEVIVKAVMFMCAVGRLSLGRKKTHASRRNDEHPNGQDVQVAHTNPCPCINCALIKHEVFYLFTFDIWHDLMFGMNLAFAFCLISTCQVK